MSPAWICFFVLSRPELPNIGNFGRQCHIVRFAESPRSKSRRWLAQSVRLISISATIVFKSAEASWKMMPEKVPALRAIRSINQGSPPVANWACVVLFVDARRNTSID